MSITKSYNNRTGCYYAYDTNYEWDEKLQKKVVHKKIIGKFDPVTGELIPNGKVGRPLKHAHLLEGSQKTSTPEIPGKDTDVEALKAQCAEMESVLKNITSNMSSINENLTSATALFLDLKDKIDKI